MEGGKGVNIFKTFFCGHFFFFFFFFFVSHLFAAQADSKQKNFHLEFPLTLVG